MSIHLTGLVISAAIATVIVFGAPAPSVSDSDCNLITQFTDTRYPLTAPIVFPDGSVKHRIAIISDLDAKSVSPDEPFTWISYFKKGYLTYTPTTKKVLIEWDDCGNGDLLKSNLSTNGRGLELSELTTYYANLITIDDKTGWIYCIHDKVLKPWVMITDVVGRTMKGMKNEWATVKDSKLYVGSHGREFVSEKSQEVIHNSFMWVTTIDKSGIVEYVDWTEQFTKVRAAVGIHFPGYMTHEAVEWSDVHGRWFFLPRKASEKPFNDLMDEQRATNVLLSASPLFDDFKVVHIGKIVPNHGYASFKFIPGTSHNVITAISTKEDGNATATFITVFTVNGTILFPETKVLDLKYEGFEFI